MSDHFVQTFKVDETAWKNVWCLEKACSFTQRMWGDGKWPFIQKQQVDGMSSVKVTHLARNPDWYFYSLASMITL